MKWYPIHSNSKWNQIRLSLTHRNSLIKDYDKCFIIAMWKVPNAGKIQHCISKARRDAGWVLFGEEAFSAHCGMLGIPRLCLLMTKDTQSSSSNSQDAIRNFYFRHCELWSSLLGIQKSFTELCLDAGHLTSCVIAGYSPSHPCGRHARKPPQNCSLETLGLTRFPPDAF